MHADHGGREYIQIFRAGYPTRSALSEDPVFDADE